MNEPTYCVKQTYALWNFKIEKKSLTNYELIRWNGVQRWTLSRKRTPVYSFLRISHRYIEIFLLKNMWISIHILFLIPTLSITLLACILYCFIYKCGNIIHFIHSLRGSGRRRGTKEKKKFRVSKGLVIPI